jgi:hypothetical protein
MPADIQILLRIGNEQMTPDYVSKFNELVIRERNKELMKLFTPDKISDVY